MSRQFAGQGVRKTPKSHIWLRSESEIRFVFTPTPPISHVCLPAYKSESRKSVFHIILCVLLIDRK